MNEMKKEIKKEQEIENKIKKEHEMEREIERTVSDSRVETVHMVRPDAVAGRSCGTCSKTPYQRKCHYGFC
mgnify:CR=1 FL=1